MRWSTFALIAGGYRENGAHNKAPLISADLESHLLALEDKPSGSGQGGTRREIRISIIVPFHNSVETLESTISSVVDQTSAHWELILVDDRSKDGSLEIAQAAQSRHPRKITVVQSQGIGAGSARNTGIDSSNADLIGFLDSDDLLSRHYVQINCGLFQDRDLSAAIFGFLNTGIESRRLTEAEYAIRNLDYSSRSSLVYGTTGRPFTSVSPMIWNKIFTRKLIEESAVRFPSSEEMIEDLPTVYPWLLGSESCWIETSLLYVQRNRADSLLSRHLSEFGFLFRSLCELRQRTAHLLRHPQQRDFEEFVEQQVTFGLSRGSDHFASGFLDNFDQLVEDLHLSGLAARRLERVRARASSIPVLNHSDRFPETRSE